MKRFWIGIGVLVAILLASFWTTDRLSEMHLSVSEDLERAAQAAQDDRWEVADTLAGNAREKWEKCWEFSAALADHTLLDEIDGLFAQAEVYRKNRDDVEYAAICGRLANHIEALQEGHKLSWWNLL